MTADKNDEGKADNDDDDNEVDEDTDTEKEESDEGCKGDGGVDAAAAASDWADADDVAPEMAAFENKVAENEATADEAAAAAAAAAAAEAAAEEEDDDDDGALRLIPGTDGRCGRCFLRWLALFLRHSEVE